jgi:hypothetical protein
MRPLAKRRDTVWRTTKAMISSSVLSKDMVNALLMGTEYEDWAMGTCCSCSTRRRTQRDQFI